MEISFRPFNLKNKAELEFVAREDSLIPLQYDPSYEWNEASVEQRIAFFNKEYLGVDHFELALDDEKIIGFHFIKTFEYPPDLQAGRVITLWVDKDYRKQGIASQLKNRGENWARLKGLSFLQTNVHVNNPHMLQINKKLGFEVIQYVMRKKI